MKILIIHYKYSISGGPERYMFNITKLLEKHGHQVIHFSINWNDNIYSTQNSYWPNLKYTQGEFHLNKIKNLGFLKKMSILKNSIYNKQVYEALNSFIKKEKPDIAYLLLFLGKLSPSVIKACNKNKIPIVSRISDFSMICLNSILYDGNKICEDCINGKFSSGIKKKCFKTYTNSFAQYLIRKYFYFRKFHKKINFYLIPSKNSLKLYSKSKYFDTQKMGLLPTFINLKQDFLTENLIEKRFNEQLFVYWGRISPEKDLELLINSFYRLQKENPNTKLILIGFQEDDFSLSILNLISSLELTSKVETFSFLKKEDIEEVVKNTTAFIFPSKIYDNLPQSVLEALAYGLPVIASDLGSLKEIILNDENGYLFDSNSKDDLLKKMSLVLKDKTKYIIQSKNALKTINKNYEENQHIGTLMKVFKKLLN